MELLIRKELENIRESGLYRKLRNLEITDNASFIIDGKKALLFAGNDYLGLSGHPEVIKAAAGAVEKYGASSGASRLITGNHQLYRQLEERLAEFKNKQSALIFSTGYMANIGFISTFAGKDDVIYIDKLDHASIYDGAKLSGASIKRYPHADTLRLEKLLKEDSGFKSKFIVTDGVFSMDGDLAPLAQLKKLSDEYNCLLVVDDAHGTGVLGKNGKGTAFFLGVGLDMEIGTLSKAIGSLGGFVAGSNEMIDYLVNKSRPFIFTTGLPPATIAAAETAIKIIQNENWRQEKVLKLAFHARKVLKEAGFKILDGITPIIPIVVGNEEKAVEFSLSCLDKGIFIPAIRTPSVGKGKARLRMTVSTTHGEEELSSALNILIASAEELKLIG
jgi:8-amino-7-oxononanoate synthase